MAAGKGNKVNRAGLAGVFGVSLPTVDSWVRSGCPYDQKGLGKGLAWVFDTADVSLWRQSVAADNAAGGDLQDADALKIRRMRAETGIVEIEYLAAKGLIAPIADMERAWSRVLAELQTNLRGSLIVRLVAQLIGETDERAFKRIALSEIDVILESLSVLDVTADGDGSDSRGASLPDD